MEPVSPFPVEFTDRHDEGQQEKIEIAILVINVIMQKSNGEKNATAKDAEEQVHVDVHVFRHPAEFHQAKNVDDKEQDIKTNGVYENTPC